MAIDRMSNFPHCSPACMLPQRALDGANTETALMPMRTLSTKSAWPVRFVCRSHSVCVRQGLPHAVHVRFSTCRQETVCIGRASQADMAFVHVMQLTSQPYTHCPGHASTHACMQCKQSQGVLSAQAHRLC